MNAVVFDIKEFSVHDGPGTRVTVFLKGCPLRCRWCHNPEGLHPEPQLLHKKNLCTECGLCMRKCNHDECDMFERCVHACPNGALCVSGKEYTSDELAAKILSYSGFFNIDGGGVTVSGGEPMLYSDFLLELVDKIGSVHKAIQTSGYTDTKTYEKVIDRFDYVMQDIKLVNREEHKIYTGVYNDVILENIEYLKNSGKEFVLRVPLIPDITDTKENLLAISKIAGSNRVELLRYNNLAGAKYEMLDKEFELKEVKGRNLSYTDYFENAIIR